MGASLTAQQVSKSFGQLRVIEEWSLTLSAGERLVILGPSGAGKTSFLRMVAGLDSPTSGNLWVDAKNIGFVFQEPRLIPWRTVKQNLLFVNQEGNAEDILNRLKLSGFEQYLPAQLSGGMLQRVNLALALIVDPDLLILDEAFSSLDLVVKLNIMKDILEQWRKKQFTMVAVTHDLKEALSMADKILIVSSRPSRIIKEFKVDLDREHRNFTDPHLLQLESELLHIIAAV